MHEYTILVSLRVRNYSSVELEHNYDATDRDFIMVSLSPRKRFAYLSPAVECCILFVDDED